MSVVGQDGERMWEQQVQRWDKLETIENEQEVHVEEAEQERRETAEAGRKNWEDQIMEDLCVSCTGVEYQEFCFGSIRFDYSLELRRELGAEM